MEFKVKRDYLLITLTNLLLLVLLFIPFVGLISDGAAPIFFFILFGIVLTTLVLFDTAVIFASCEVRSNVLVFRTGAFKHIIFLDTVISARKVLTVDGSLIVSMDRIKIHTIEKDKLRTYYLSVVDNDKLLDMITANIPADADKPVVKKLKPKTNKLEVKTPDTKVEKFIEVTAEKTQVKKPLVKKSSAKTVEKKSAVKKNIEKNEGAKMATKPAAKPVAKPAAKPAVKKAPAKNK